MGDLQRTGDEILETTVQPRLAAFSDILTITTGGIGRLRWRMTFTRSALLRSGFAMQMTNMKLEQFCSRDEYDTVRCEKGNFSNQHSISRRQRWMLEDEAILGLRSRFVPRWEFAGR